MMRIGILTALFCLASPHLAHAQAPKPTVIFQKTRVDPKAIAAVDEMMGRYKELHSYSSKCEVTLEKAEKWSQKERSAMSLSATVAFERPSKLRLEGKQAKGTFLLVNDGKETHIVNPNNVGIWAQRPQSSPIGLWADFSRSNVALPAGAPLPIDGGWQEVGTAPMSEGYMFRPEALLNERDQMVEAAFGADETVEGQECRVVQMSTDYGAENVIKSRLWIAKSDGLLRRIERDFGAGGRGLIMIENLSDIRPNPELPAETWNFTPPADSKPTERIPDPYPATLGLKIKMGDPLPVFSQDDINDEVVELNPEGGGVTLLYFFFVNLAGADSASLQRLQNALGKQGLQVIGCAGDSQRKRIQELIAKNKLSFPVYFDEKAYQNKLITAVGVG
ncbi:redoxin domain-containing protein, partial [bacterium]